MLPDVIHKFDAYPTHGARYESHPPTCAIKDERARIERLLAQLRRFRLPTPSLEEVELSALVARCISQLRADSPHGAIEINMDIPRSCSVRSESIYLEAAMRHFLLNGVANCSARNRITMSAILIDLDADRRLQLDIVDDGAEVTPRALFRSRQSLSHHAARATRSFSMRVLILDDQAVARKTIARCLAPLSDVEIHEATSLTEANQILSRNLIDVALIDLRLDERDDANRDGLILVAGPLACTEESKTRRVRLAPGKILTQGP